MTERLTAQANGKGLSRDEIACNFLDLHAALDQGQAIHQADRCFYCYDAPCVRACPTEIDIPKFIHQIRTGNVKGSATTILASNIMGGTCARACPTEVLCEQVCVRNAGEDKPVEIGLLQRYAVDHLLSLEVEHPFKRAAETGKTVAVIGAGPAGLSAAHRLAMLGHDVVVFDGQEKPGGLNEYGLAAYKMVDEFAQKEVEFLLGVGGINVEYSTRLNRDFTIAELNEKYDAVFVGVGLSMANNLSTQGSELDGIQSAVSFIEHLRQAEHPADISVPENIVVIGGGNTAIDAAIQSKRLGAKNVTLVYRRGPEQMSATLWEQDLAKKNDVVIRYWLAPSAFVANDSENVAEGSEKKGVVTQAIFNGSKMNESGESVIADDVVITLDADLVLSAIGQGLHGDELHGLEMSRGKIQIDENYQTSIQGVFAGGDCTASGDDLTVQAVEDGKQAALRIDALLLNN